MSTQTIVIIVGVVWVTIGIGLAFYMGRRGHTAFGWGVMGCVLGPFALILAAQAIADEPSRSSARPIDGGIPGTGRIDVLVGVDGSPESAAAADAVVHLLGPSIGRLTLAAVGDYDRVGGRERELHKILDRQADRVEEAIRKRRLRDPEAQLPGRCGTLFLTGRPAEALCEEAAAQGYDLLVVGARGTGLAKAVLGSVSSQLAGRAKIPVMIAPSGR